MKNKTINFMLRTGFSFLMAIALLTSHVSDGNVWGIYIEHGSLLIGDFWGTFLLIAIGHSIVRDYGETYS